jgi:hypothetical protein
MKYRGVVAGAWGILAASTGWRKNQTEIAISYITGDGEAADLATRMRAMNEPVSAASRNCINILA